MLLAVRAPHLLNGTALTVAVIALASAFTIEAFALAFVAFWAFPLALALSMAWEAKSSTRLALGLETRLAAMTTTQC